MESSRAELSAGFTSVCFWETTMAAAGDRPYDMQNAGTPGKLTSANDTVVSYLFWSAGLFGFCGLHRLYNGKVVSGLLWMSTFGLLGIGQLIDLANIPAMTEAKAQKLRARQYQLGRYDDAALRQPTQAQAPPLTIQLLKLAKRNQGRLTVTDAVLETEAPFADVEHELKELVKSGYATVSNDVVSGVVVYEIPELTV